jgi:hypothetical protein
MRLSGSADGELRLNAVWALQNLVYTACSDVRKAVLAALPWPHVVALADDMRPDVQVPPPLYPLHGALHWCLCNGHHDAHFRIYQCVSEDDIKWLRTEMPIPAHVMLL